MADLTIKAGYGDTLRVDHPDGGCTLIVFHAEWEGISVLSPVEVARIRDRRRYAGPRKVAHA